MLIKFFTLLFIFCCDKSYQDVYLHNPRGSNNRLNENTAERKNDNRLFDSQNNQRGGYNVGDRLNKPASNENDQYQMRYFQSGVNGKSYLNIEWSEQHGCSGINNEKVDGLINKNCLIVLQYMCQTTSEFFEEKNLDRLRDGTSTLSQDHTKLVEDTLKSHMDRKYQNVKLDRGLQETWEHYDNCYYRQRNLNLFTADQVLKSNEKGYSSAIFTRQNPNGERSGYECPEERDYYPYWHPNGGWNDIAILTNNITQCEFYKNESFNVKPKYMCYEFYSNGAQKHWSRWNNEADCLNNSGSWVEVYNYLEKLIEFDDQESCESSGPNRKWTIAFDSKDIKYKECLVMLQKPECKHTEWTRQNNLGNTLEGKMPGYLWQLPHFPTKRSQKCVLRIRYNITTNDFDHLNIDSNSNGANSPVKNNPQFKFLNSQTLRLAIDTTQVGRVFQDRSHSFYLIGRSYLIRDIFNIYNLNVKGKRGNIVQTYPSIQYDFAPSNLKIRENDLVHIQWTGSNTEPQASVGQGKQGTDRSNLLLINHPKSNRPLQFNESTLWQEIEIIGFLDSQHMSNDDANRNLIRYTMTDDIRKDLYVYLSSSSYYQCLNKKTCDLSLDMTGRLNLDVDLNEAPASLPGALVKFKKSNQTYHFMSTRNSLFSVRNQIGSLIVV